MARSRLEGKQGRSFRRPKVISSAFSDRVQKILNFGFARQLKQILVDRDRFLFSEAFRTKQWCYYER